jgi:hypothetical protein
MDIQLATKISQTQDKLEKFYFQTFSPYMEVRKGFSLWWQRVVSLYFCLHLDNFLSKFGYQISDDVEKEVEIIGLVEDESSFQQLSKASTIARSASLGTFCPLVLLFSF